MNDEKRSNCLQIIFKSIANLSLVYKMKTICDLSFYSNRALIVFENGKVWSALRHVCRVLAPTLNKIVANDNFVGFHNKSFLEKVSPKTAVTLNVPTYIIIFICIYTLI